MRFLVEVLHSTLVPYTVEADTGEEALAFISNSEEGEVLPGDPEHQPSIVKRIRILGE